MAANSGDSIMALRKEADRGADVDRVGEEPQAPPTANNGKEAPESGVRPEVRAIIDQVVKDRRGLLDRLAAYDRGDTTER